MVVTYYNKLFRTGPNRHNGILMSLLPLLAETKINELHKRCLRIIYNDKTSSFEILLEKDGSVSIHNRNLQDLATEMFKISRGISSWYI